MRKFALINGKVYVERDVFAQAVYAEDGIIKLVGSNEQVLSAAGAEAEVIDAQGKTVIPGLNDSHQHLMQIGSGLATAQTAGATSMAELIQRVKDFIAANPERAAKGVRSSGWNQDLFTDEKRMPTRWDLDKISTEIPIFLRRVCGHVGVANSKIIEMLGLDEKMVEVPGGTIEVDENGRPNGIFTENGNNLPDSCIPVPTVEDYEAFFLKGAEYALSVGLTSVQSNDAGNSNLTMDKLFPMVRKIYDEGKCPLRYRHQVCFHDIEGFKAYVEGEFKNGRYDNPNMLALGPLKLFKDGSLGGRTGTMRNEYQDDPGNYGVETTTDPEMEAFCKVAADAGIQVVTHVIGDKAIEDTIGNYEHVMVDGKNPLRHALVHCQITDKPLMERIAKDDIAIMYQPIFLDYDMHAVISRCGEELSSTSYAFKTAEDLGIHVSYGTDSPVENCNPFPNIYSAVTRKDKTGFPEGGFFPQECVDVATAIDAYTAGSAYNEFRENDKGRIKPGFLADMVVLDTDIFTCDPMKIRDILPVMTIVDGKVAFKK